MRYRAVVVIAAVVVILSGCDVGLATRGGLVVNNTRQDLVVEPVGVSDASIEVRRGEIFCIMGLSGSGKSTLIRLLNKLIAPSSGKVLVKGRELAALSPVDLRQMRARNIGTRAGASSQSHSVTRKKNMRSMPRCSRTVAVARRLPSRRRRWARWVL